MSYALEIEGLTKTYAKSSNKALDNLSLKIRKGSIFGLLGPNGSGKSTLINIIAGIVKKDTGKVMCMEYDLDTKLQKVKKIIGVVPQEVVIDNFFPIKTLLNLTSGYYGIYPNQNHIDNILKILGLYEKRYNLSRGLSGGMKRRFLIAKALVHSPKILILDEPTAGVDIKLREELWDYIKILNNQGITVILTTHYLQEAQFLCDEIAFINKGKITKQDLKQNLLLELGVKELFIEFKSNLEQSQIDLLQANSFSLLSPNSCKILLSSNNNINNLLNFILKVNIPIENLNISKPDIEYIFKQLIQA